jgi:hypothetical protein
MGKVYGPPIEVGIAPRLDSRNETFQAYQTREDAYIGRVQEWARNNGNGTLAGELVSFPFADGHALYVILSLRPVTLIHLPVGDSWQYPHVERLTAKDIKEEVRRRKAISKLFGRKDDEESKVEICPQCGASCNGDVTIADHGRCIDCHHAMLNEGDNNVDS